MRTDAWLVLCLLYIKLKLLYHASLTSASVTIKGTSDKGGIGLTATYDSVKRPAIDWSASMSLSPLLAMRIVPGRRDGAELLYWKTRAVRAIQVLFCLNFTVECQGVLRS